MGHDGVILTALEAWCWVDIMVMMGVFRLLPPENVGAGGPADEFPF